MTPRRLLALLSITAAGVGLAGCGGQEVGEPLPGPRNPQAELSLDEPAAELRVKLVELLGDLVFFTGQATESAARVGVDSELVQAAREEVRKTREELVAELAMLGPGSLRERLAEAWSALDSALFDHLTTQVRTDPPTTQVRPRIEEHVAEIAELTAEATPALEVGDVEARLGRAVEELLRAIELVAGKAPGAAERLSASATAMQGLGGVFAHAIATGPPAQVEGSAVSEAALLTSDLAALFAEEFHLTVVALQTGLRTGFDSGQYKAAARIVDSSAGTLVDRIATVPEGGDDRQALLGLLRSHYDLFVEYTKALRGGTQTARVEEIKRAMERLAHRLALVLAQELPVGVSQLEEPFTKADKELRAAVKDMLNTRPAMYDHVATATHHAATVGDRLAGGLLRAAAETR